MLRRRPRAEVYASTRRASAVRFDVHGWAQHSTGAECDLWSSVWTTDAEVAARWVRRQVRRRVEAMYPGTRFARAFRS